MLYLAEGQPDQVADGCHRKEEGQGGTRPAIFFGRFPSYSKRQASTSHLKSSPSTRGKVSGGLTVFSNLLPVIRRQLIADS